MAAVPKKPRRRPKPAIVFQETVKEVDTKSFERVRLSRVQYAKNPYIFIDIRYFQRGYDENGDEVYHPTKRGVQLREELFLSLANQTVLLGLKRKLASTSSRRT